MVDSENDVEFVYKEDQIFNFLECYDKDSQTYYDIQMVCINWECDQSILIIFNDISNTIINKRLECI